MNQYQQLQIKEIRVETTAPIGAYKEERLLEIHGWDQKDILDLEEIIPRRLTWSIYQFQGEKEGGKLELSERLITPGYGDIELEQNLREMAKKAPGIRKIWEITKDLPSLTKILLREREQE